VLFPTSPALTSDRIGALFDLSQRIAAIPHVTKVESIVSGGGMGRDDYQTLLLDPPDLYRAQVDAGKKMTVGDRAVVLYALLDSAPETQASQEVIRRLRSDRAVKDGTLWVGGQTASDMDATAFVRERTARAIGFVVAMTLFILFLLFGSVVANHDDPGEATSDAWAALRSTCGRGSPETEQLVRIAVGLGGGLSSTSATAPRLISSCGAQVGHGHCRSEEQAPAGLKGAEPPEAQP
jgi:hypothetical protein